ncbi:hypothetical protein HLB23_07900 [Nocardia uniformis]|uniref:Uncharacterized protein n=1 Tax=Nocardia uniformis TaxID=53432 RepID=A0A849C499_9NOCA|nr:hypothetical protein [Nocardia uniformis]NNH69789.1 hypothetical protein [Nocardia uniformis]
MSSTQRSSANSTANHSGAGSTANTAAHPAKWKIWLLTLIGLYPMLTVLVMLTAPLLESLPTPLRLACILPVAVGAMVWVIMPRLTKLCAGWLAR